MITRPLALTGLLGAAVGGPYLISNPPEGFAPSANEQQVEQAAENAPPATGVEGWKDPQGPGSNIYTSPAGLTGPVGMPLETALDWSVTPNWVYRHWARKSTGLGDPSLFGVRVPLVTGSGMTDVAGSLTYYFNQQGVLQRMRLVGSTADTSRIVHLATSRFQMAPTPNAAPGEKLYRAGDDKLVQAELRSRPSGTLWATSPHTSFDVRFEATRPGSGLAVQSPQLSLEIPDESAGQASAAAAPSEPTEQAILPPRAVVPDRPPQSTAAAEAATPNAEGAATPSAPTSGPSAPTASGPAPSVEPLNGYRERFRWPG